VACLRVVCFCQALLHLWQRVLIDRSWYCFLACLTTGAVGGYRKCFCSQLNCSSHAHGGLTRSRYETVRAYLEYPTIAAGMATFAGLSLPVVASFLNCRCCVVHTGGIYVPSTTSMQVEDPIAAGKRLLCLTAAAMHCRKSCLLSTECAGDGVYCRHIT
jgi:hypothetical protein